VPKSTLATVIDKICISDSMQLDLVKI